jgi:acid phosphatase
MRVFVATTLAWSAASAVVVGAVVASGGRAAVASPSPHIMVVMMENKNYSDVIGKSNQPFTNGLANRYGLATHSYAVNHPSLPNYLDIVTGQDPSNATDDGPPSNHTYNYTTIAGQLHAAGISEKAYAENLPGDPTNDSYPYAVRHFPWEYFPGTVMTIGDASSMVSDLNNANPPAFVWYTPNVINDEHDGSVQQGDAFLASFIPNVQSTAWYRAGGQIIVTWDESASDNTNGGGHVPTIVVSAALQASPQQSTSTVNTTGILNSIEDVYGVGHLASGTGTIDSLLNAGGGGASNRAFTNSASATGVAGTTFSFPIGTTGTPTPSLKKRGRLPAGLHFLNNHNGTALIWGTANPKKAIGTKQITIVATYGKHKAKQVTTQVITLTIFP